MAEEKKNISGGKVGAVLGAASASISTLMTNPIGRWAIFTAQDSVGDGLHRFIYNIAGKTPNAYEIASGVKSVYNGITNTIMAYPAILPIAAGVLGAGVGALVGNTIKNAKLKRKSLPQKEQTKTK